MDVRDIALELDLYLALSALVKAVEVADNWLDEGLSSHHPTMNSAKEVLAVFMKKSISND